MNGKQRLVVRPLAGIDERVPQRQEAASIIQNFTVDKKTGGWDDRIGYEKYFSSEDAYGPFDNDTRVHSIFVWSTHGNALEYVLYEATDKTSGETALKYLVGNPADAITLSSDRNTPTNDEPVTDYEPFGRFLIILNGHDAPVKFDGRKLTQLGWHSIPNPPRLWQPDNNFTEGAEQQAFPCVEYERNFDDWYGLGSKTADATNTYRYKVSFINEAGSESPISNASELVTWTTLPGVLPYSRKRHAVYLEDLPIGPEGTIARKLYRTPNLGNYEEGEELYFLAGTVYNNTETWYVDYKADTALGASAPADSDSIVFPAFAARFAANFKGTLFIDGGQAKATRIYYSNPLQPDSFSSLNFFDVGSRKGGDITALIPYYNQLLVFRESAIEVIRGDANSGFTIAPFHQGVGTKAVHTIEAIPDLGMVFLAGDGVWLISGGWDGGSELKINNITKRQIDTIDRANTDLLARASGTYSSKWREYHCCFAADGSAKPNLGLVLHLENNEWTTRGAEFPVGFITSNSRGDIIFGNHTGNTQPPGDPNVDFEAGLFVVTRYRSSGYEVAGSGIAGALVATPTGTPVSSWYRSRWHDFGYPNQKKYVKYIYLYVLTEGDNSIPVTYYKDYSSTGSTSSECKIQRAEYADQPVYDTAIWDTDAWSKGLVTEIRYEVAQAACSHFCFEVETTNDIILVGYALEFETNLTKTTRGKRV
jgi:hypothetical protein